jgi:excisionase family DNA binding protein
MSINLRLFTDRYQTSTIVDMQDEFFTVSEMAKLKNVARSTIYLAMAEGRLPHRRILGRLVITKSDARSWKPVPHAGRRKGTPVSAEIRSRISETQKQRWARRKQTNL